MEEVDRLRDELLSLTKGQRLELKLLTKAETKRLRKRLGLANPRRRKVR